MATVFQRAAKLLSVVEDSVFKIMCHRFPPEYFAPALVDSPHLIQNNKNCKEKSLIEALKESVLWAVPKRRRTIEKRRSRRFGWPKYVYKILLPKTNILICDECGSYKEAGRLCPNCYSRVMQVTKEMQECIEKNLGISPVENEVVLLYSDDVRENPEFYKGKRIVEMKKERPKLFSDNLLQKSTQTPATSQEIAEVKEVS